VTSPNEARRTRDLRVGLEGDRNRIALELAAAHTGVLGPDEMLARLRNTLEVLTGGSAELPGRQQTMRATLDWDYDLLTEAEKLIWRRLSVPSGGFTVEAAQAIIDAPGYPPSYIVDAIESLVAKSLLTTQTRGEEGARFSMLKPCASTASKSWITPARAPKSGTGTRPSSLPWRKKARRVCAGRSKRSGSTSSQSSTTTRAPHCGGLRRREITSSSCDCLPLWHRSGR
jgi:hypothetical protein